MKRTLLLSLCVGLLAFAASSRFSATTGDVSLSGAGTALTIQQPAKNGAPISLESATVYCSVACNVTQTQDGAAATATAGTAVPLLPTPSVQSAVATVWTASNASGGTTAGGILHIPAGSTVPIDLSKVALGPGAGTGSNYTITVSSITGTANITVVWAEQR